MSDGAKKLCFRAREYSIEHTTTEGGGAWIQIPLRNPVPCVQRALVALQEAAEEHHLADTPEYALQRTYELGYEEATRSATEAFRDQEQQIAALKAEVAKLKEQLTERGEALEQALSGRPSPSGVAALRGIEALIAHAAENAIFRRESEATDTYWRLPVKKSYAGMWSDFRTVVEEKSKGVRKPHTYTLLMPVAYAKVTPRDDHTIEFTTPGQHHE